MNYLIYLPLHLVFTKQAESHDHGAERRNSVVAPDAQDGLLGALARALANRREAVKSESGKIYKLAVCISVWFNKHLIKRH